MSERPDLPGDLSALAREDLASAEALDKDERISDSPSGVPRAAGGGEGP